MLTNQAAKIRYLFGGQIGVPMVLRTQGGTGRSAGAKHSPSLEAWIMHTPGLRLAMPATAHDAYHLLRQAVVQPDPVVFIEHKALYAKKEQTNLAALAPPWRKAAVRREGSRSGDRDLFPAGVSCAGGGREAGGRRRRGDRHRPAHAEPARHGHGARMSSAPARRWSSPRVP